jgi:hypothetical protein
MRQGPQKALTGSALDSRVAQFGQRSMIKRIQRGTITVASAVTATGTITAVDVNNSVLMFLGDLAQTATANYNDSNCYIELTNSTTLTITRSGAAPGYSTVSYEVIEYWPGVLKSIQRGTISLGGVASSTATITAVDTQKASLIYLGRFGNNAADPSRQLIMVVLTNSTTVTASRVTGTDTEAVSYQVAQYY